MNTNDVLGANQAGVVEIAGFKIKRIKGSLRPIGGIVVAACDTCFQTNPGSPRVVPRITGIQTGGPGKDGFICETSGLEHGFPVPIPLIPLAEPARSKRMPLLVSCSRSVLSVLTGDAKIVNVQAVLVRSVEPVRQV